MAQLPRSMRSVSVLALVLACLLVPRIASAQFDAATVLGAVTDATGARVPGATVTLKNADTGIVSTTITDSEGNYQFLNVRIGTYSVRAELQGFSAAIAENITIVVNARQRVDLTMKVGDVGETVVVQGSGPVGLAAAMYAQLAGAAKTILVGGPASRLDPRAPAGDPNETS